MPHPASKDLVERLLDAYDSGTSIAPITENDPSFDLAAAYAVLAEIERRRIAQGWRPVGRKIGFTNQNLWESYGVSAPMWARVWDRTLITTDGTATIVTPSFPELRVEPEIAFCLSRELGPTDDPLEVLDATAWIAASFEFVWSPYPGWRFALPDCTAAFGLHGALVLGTPLEIDRSIADVLPAVEVTLSRNGTVVDRGVGANVLGGPAHALAHLSRVVDQPLASGEIITTGTVTDAHAVLSGDIWSSHYGGLGLLGLSLTLT